MIVVTLIILLIWPCKSFSQSKETVLKGNLEWRSCPSDKPIKGNINSFKGTKIYHKPEGAFYNRTNPEVCFSSIAEAESRGFRPSSK